MQLPEDAWQLLQRDMEQHGIGKIQLKEVLLQHLATAVLAGHLREALGAVEADGSVAQLGESLEVPAGMRSRPGPQPKSRTVNGAGPWICRSRASMFWLTSWSRVPSRKPSAVRL